jgi:hypothetical protein
MTRHFSSLGRFLGIERQFARKVKGRPVKAMATHPIGVD